MISRLPWRELWLPLDEILLLDWCGSGVPLHLTLSSVTGWEKRSAAFSVRCLLLGQPKFPMQPHSVVAGSSSGEFKISSMLRDLRPCSKFLELLILLGVEVLWCICSSPWHPEPSLDCLLSPASALLADDDRTWFVRDGHDAVSVDTLDDERRDVDVDMLAKLASVECSGLVILASADAIVDETEEIVSIPFEPDIPVHGPIRLLPEKGKSNLGNDENAILLGLTVGLLAFVSDDLSATCEADPGPDVSIGTIAWAPVGLLSMALILSGRLVPPEERGAASPVNLKGESSLAKHGVKLTWSNEVSWDLLDIGKVRLLGLPVAL